MLKQHFGSTCTRENEGKTDNSGWILCLAYAVFGVHCILCMLYSVYAVLGLCCTQCEPMVMAWRDRDDLTLCSAIMVE